MIGQVEVWAQCSKCGATLTVSFLARGDSIISIDPDSRITDNCHVLTHRCGGTLRFFTFRAKSQEYKFEKPEKYRRERRKAFSFIT